MRKKKPANDMAKVILDEWCKWNYTCGKCRTHYIGVANTEYVTDEWGKAHDAACDSKRWASAI